MILRHQIPNDAFAQYADEQALTLKERLE